MKYLVIETYCDNWAETLDYNVMLEFEAPSRPDPQPGASFADMENWHAAHAVPALRQAARRYPRATYPRAVIAAESAP